MTFSEPELAAWLGRTPAISTAWLFGSRARGSARPDSDIDIAVLAAAPVPDPLRRRVRWTTEAALALGLPMARIDLIDLSDAPPLLAIEVLRDGRLLLDRDPDARMLFQVRALPRAIEARRLRDIAMRARAVRHGVLP